MAIPIIENYLSFAQGTSSSPSCIGLDRLEGFDFGDASESLSEYRRLDEISTWFTWVEVVGKMARVDRYDSENGLACVGVFDELPQRCRNGVSKLS